MPSPMVRGLALWVLVCAAWSGCEGERVLVPEAPAVPRAAPAPAPEKPEGVLGASAARDGKPPLLGSDPYGLLSKPSPSSGAKRERIDPSKLDPSALMEPDAKAKSDGKAGELERDPRAVARSQIIETPRPDDEKQGPTRIVNVSPDAVATRVIRGSGRPHVLLLYGAFCPACREAMPGFVSAARSYTSRNVGFTLASVDREPERFAKYAPILGGAFDALLITSDVPGSTTAALKRMGITFDGDSYGVPFLAVFDRSRRVVSRGHGEAMAQIGKTLDSLLAN